MNVPTIAKCQSCRSENLELIDDERDIYLCKDCGKREKKEVINMCDGDCEIGDNLEVIE